MTNTEACRVVKRMMSDWNAATEEERRAAIAAAKAAADAAEGVN